MRKDDEAVLIDAPLRPFPQRHFEGVTECRLLDPTPRQRLDELTRVAEQADVAHDLAPVLRAQTDEELPRAAELLRAEGRLPVEVADVGVDLPPLRGEQVDD